MHPINMISLQVLIPNVLTMELSLHKKKKKKKKKKKPTELSLHPYML